MKAYIGVTSNPFYAITGQSGTFTLKNLPPGRYTLEAWTAIFGTEDKQVRVEPGRTVTADFTFRSAAGSGATTETAHLRHGFHKGLSK
jgi:hypothetical protein